MVDLSTVDNSAINEMAIQFATIIILILAVGFAFGLVLKVIKAPQFLFKPIVTLAMLIGAYFIFTNFFS